MKKQTFNPYLPSWEYIPDGEPHVFNGRIYVFGSHDYYNGYVFCLGDYVCWSRPENVKVELIGVVDGDYLVNMNGKVNVISSFNAG